MTFDGTRRDNVWQTAASYGAFPDRNTTRTASDTAWSANRS